MRGAVEPLLLAGRIATCGIVDLELLEVQGLVEVQGLLAARSQHRAVPLPDLLVAACAERDGLTVLHYDGDFELIAEVTRQETH